MDKFEKGKEIETNREIARKYGFTLWNSGGGIVVFEKDYGKCYAIVGCADSPEYFENTSGSSPYWGFNINKDDGEYLDEYSLITETTLEDAILNAELMAKLYLKHNH